MKRNPMSNTATTIEAAKKTNGKICKANSRRTFSKWYWLGCWYNSLAYYLERFARAKKIIFFVFIIYFIVYFQ